MNEMSQSWTFKFHKVVRQQNSGVVEDFILPYFRVYLRFQKWKNYWNRSTLAKVIVKIKVAPFYGPRCILGNIRNCLLVTIYFELYCLKKLRFVPSTILKLLAFNAQKLKGSRDPGHAPFSKIFFRGHVGTFPGSIRAKFEVHTFNRFEAVSI